LKWNQEIITSLELLLIHNMNSTQRTQLSQQEKERSLHQLLANSPVLLQSQLCSPRENTEDMLMHKPTVLEDILFIQMMLCLTLKLEPQTSGFLKDQQHAPYS
jgi:hypothetical protein